MQPEIAGGAPTRLDQDAGFGPTRCAGGRGEEPACERIGVPVHGADPDPAIRANARVRLSVNTRKHLRHRAAPCGTEPGEQTDASAARPGAPWRSS